MHTMTAVTFAGPMNVHMSGLVASRIHNLNPVPDKIVFITPDANLLRELHRNKVKTDIPIEYINDWDVCRMFNTNKPALNWLDRQWIQLHLDLLIQDSQYILTLDADVIINCPLQLFDLGRINLFIETERYEPYFKTMKQLLPNLTKFLPHGESFNADFMMLIPAQLKALREEMNISYIEWEKLSIDNGKGSKVPGFADYETMGTWMLNQVPDRINLVKSETYNDNCKFCGKHKLSDLLEIKSIIPLRQVRDHDIDWYN